jgi:hypothetical protein
MDVSVLQIFDVLNNSLYIEVVLYVMADLCAGFADINRSKEHVFEVYSNLRPEP